MLSNTINFDKFNNEKFELSKVSEAQFLSAKKIQPDALLNFEPQTIGGTDSYSFSPLDIVQSSHSKDTAHAAKRIFISLRNNDLKFGYNSQTQTIVEDLMSTHGATFVDETLAKVLATYIAPSGQPQLMCKFLALISAFEAEDLPLTCTFSVTSFSHKKYNSVKESLLIAIEVLRFKEAIPLLKDLEPYSREYLEIYKNKVIAFLEGL